MDTDTALEFVKPRLLDAEFNMENAHTENKDLSGCSYKTSSFENQKGVMSATKKFILDSGTSDHLVKADLLEHMESVKVLKIPYLIVPGRYCNLLSVSKINNRGLNFLFSGYKATILKGSDICEE
ncbi:hypothetical protein PR048_005829, partial [Dryococelus australis]